MPRKHKVVGSTPAPHTPDVYKVEKVGSEAQVSARLEVPWHGRRKISSTPVTKKGKVNGKSACPIDNKRETTASIELQHITECGG